MSTIRRAFTIVELLIVVAIIALLIAILLPAINKARDSALVTQSNGNLTNLGKACAAYAADWNDAQFSATPDDIGQFADCAAYVASGGCPRPYLALGCAVPIAGSGLASTEPYNICATGTPTCNTPKWISSWPSSCDGNNTGQMNGATVTNWGPGYFGAWRVPNGKALNGYVNGRFYDKVFYAPKDRMSLEFGQMAFASPTMVSPTDTAVTLPNGTTQNVYLFSTYCLSPAAMWSPDVFNFGSPAPCPTPFNGSTGMPGAWRAPSRGQAKFPDLKTNALEHYWLQNTEGGFFNTTAPFNAGNKGPYPWLFNHGYNSSPATLFFDGHVAAMGVADAQEGDSRVLKQNNCNPSTPLPPCFSKGLWHRGTWMGPVGYYNTSGYDMLVNCAYHVLTTDGIQGRDTIGKK